MKNEVYVTFYTEPTFGDNGNRFAVCCNGMEKAMEVAHDANSLIGVKNIRLRKCGKPSERIILSYDDYFRYSCWY